MRSWQGPAATNTQGTSLVSGFQSEEVCKCYIWIYSAHTTSSSQSSSLPSIVTRIVYTSLVRWLCWMCACVHCHTFYFFPSNLFVVRAYVSSFFSLIWDWNYLDSYFYGFRVLFPHRRTLSSPRVAIWLYTLHVCMHAFRPSAFSYSFASPCAVAFRPLFSRNIFCVQFFYYSLRKLHIVAHRLTSTAWNNM